MTATKKIYKDTVKNIRVTTEYKRERPASERRNQQKTRTIRPFRIKEILPQQKAINIRKNGQIIKTINVGRKSWYFSGRNRIIF